MSAQARHHRSAAGATPARDLRGAKAGQSDSGGQASAILDEINKITEAFEPKQGREGRAVPRERITRLFASIRCASLTRGNNGTPAEHTAKRLEKVADRLEIVFKKKGQN